MQTEHIAQHETLISRQELRRRFPVSETTVWRWAQKGLLKPVRISGRPYYRESDIVALITEGDAAPPSLGTVKASRSGRNYRGTK